MNIKKPSLKGSNKATLITWEVITIDNYSILLWTDSYASKCYVLLIMKLQMQRLNVLGCMFAVVTAGKQLIRGSEGIVLFSAITKKNPRTFSLSVYSDTLYVLKKTNNTSITLLKLKTRLQLWALPQAEERAGSRFALSDLLILAPPGSIWLLLAALMGLKGINLGGLLSSYQHMRAGRQNEKSCSWVEVRRPEVQLIPRRAHMSNRPLTTLTSTQKYCAHV